MANNRSLRVRKNKNWTAESAEAFAHKLAFDFIAQLERRIEDTKINKTKLAKKLGVSQGAISHVLNNPQNLTLRTIAKYSQALGAKAAIISYDDDDAENEKGLISSRVFYDCWVNAGRPRDLWEVEELHTATTAQRYFVYISVTVISSGQAVSTYAEPSMSGLTCPIPSQQLQLAQSSSAQTIEAQ